MASRVPEKGGERGGAERVFAPPFPFPLPQSSSLTLRARKREWNGKKAFFRFVRGPRSGSAFGEVVKSSFLQNGGKKTLKTEGSDLQSTQARNQVRNEIIHLNYSVLNATNIKLCSVGTFKLIF